MKRKLPEELEPSCSLCEHALRIEVKSQTICTCDGLFKVVTPEDNCRKFRFDILSYRPMPAKLPKFDISDDTNII